MNPADLKIVLVKPRNPDNIGAAARAMANFGLTDLALVGAFGSDWNEAAKNWRLEASVSAVHSMDVVESARLYDTITEAAAGCSLILGTSALHWLKPDRDVVLLSRAPDYITANSAGKTAILFGCEKSGLTNEDLSFCRAIINIPTQPKQPSMNLGQAVAVTAYELAARGTATVPAAMRESIEAIPEEIERMVRQISEKLQRDAGPHWGGEAQVKEIRRGLTDARLTKGAMNALKQLLKGK